MAAVATVAAEAVDSVQQSGYCILCLVVFVINIDYIFCCWILDLPILSLCLSLILLSIEKSVRVDEKCCGMLI